MNKRNADDGEEKSVERSMVKEGEKESAHILLSLYWQVSQYDRSSSSIDYVAQRNLTRHCIRILVVFFSYRFVILFYHSTKKF